MLAFMRFTVAAAALAVCACTFMWMFGGKQPERTSGNAAIPAANSAPSREVDQSRKPAPIIDGPDYLASKNAAAASTPDSMPDAYKPYPDVHIQPLDPSGPFTEQVLVLMPYGPCGTLSQIGDSFLWVTDSERALYSTAAKAANAAAAECEATYLQDRANREAIQAMSSGSR